MNTDFLAKSIVGIGFADVDAGSACATAASRTAPNSAANPGLDIPRSPCGPCRTLSPRPPAPCRPRRFIYSRPDPSAEHFLDAVEDVVHRAFAVDRGELVLLLVVVDQRRGLVLIDLEALADHFLVVVRALHELAAVVIADALLLRRAVVDVVEMAADAAGAPAREPLDQAVELHVQQDRLVQRLALGLEHLVERLRLRERAREAVEDEAEAGVLRAQPLADHADDDVVGDQLAGVHR